uniref:Crystaline entomocidal protoxin n=1 Tax=Bacillus thuringiensis TaxID=1428 RepID=U5KS14_BACTU|nr:pesticidal protein [Bacillus thuringiensis]
MNRNNQNEYEIIDAPHCGCPSDDVVKYPLTDDPNAGLQNMNYKEYLQMYGGDYTDPLINPNLSVSGKDVIQVGINIVGRLLSFFGFPFSSQWVTVYTYLLNSLWPDDENSVWDAFMKRVEELIDQKISEAVKGRALDDLTGLQENYNLYVAALDEWLNRPNGARASLVSQRFNILDSLFTQFMPSFGSGPGSQNYATILLPVYAQAANLHLLLLKDADIYGARWGLNQTQIDQFHSRQQSLTLTYTNHCVTAYNDGLAELRGTSVESWLKYHQYRREMTVTAMDLVALFPYYNVRQYPNGANPQLTREVYTDPIVFNPPEHPSGFFCESFYTIRAARERLTFSQLENAIIRPPRLFERFQALGIYTGELQLGQGSTPMNHWIGHFIRNTRLGDSTTITTNYGTTNNRLTNFIPPTTSDVYQINSISSNAASFLNTFFGVTRAQFHYGSGIIWSYVGQNNVLPPCLQNYNSIEELPNQSEEPTVRSYSHRLSHITSFNFNVQLNSPLRSSGNMPVYVWTHRSVDLNNTITSDRITQLPAVKASTLGAGAIVVKGPGFTGGDVIRRTSVGNFGRIRVTVNSPLTQRYRIRFRYASTTDLQIGINVGNRTVNLFDFPSTMNSGQESKYESFVTREFTTAFSFTQTQETISAFAQSFSSGQVYLDRIEIIPVNPAREAEEDLEAAKKAAASLFTRTRDGLQVNVTDYQVDQAANLVSCLSDEQYGHDKKMLLEAVRAAKRLSRERNLLQDPDFNEINSTKENGWKASNGVTISEGGPFFKGLALQLASARENYPTYIYQKVDASVLKPYTRYRLDGFVKSSQDLEIDLIHHHKVHLVKNVPDNLVSDTYSDGSCSGINRCDEQHQVDMQLDAEHHPMDCCEAAQTHEFSSYIHTGDLNSSVDQGIWVVLKVRTTDGYATLGDLELVEVGPLSGESLEREQKDNAKWNAELGRKRAETDRVYLAAKQAINHLFVDYQDQQLNPEIGLAEINEASNLVKSISGVYSDTLLQIPGINYEIYTELSDRLQQALYLYTSRNAVQNGDFNSGLDSWNATTDASVQQDGNMHFLVLSHWDAQVSQQLRVNPNCKYVLRVTARKVGGGDGYVTIRDGAHHQETLTFNACDYDVNGTYVDDNTYITKDVVFYPETKHMWVEVSESEGSFYIDSIEFIEAQE